MRTLSVVLGDEDRFDGLLPRLARAFGVAMVPGRISHRRVADAACGGYAVRAIDRADLLGPALDDPFHTLQVRPRAALDPESVEESVEEDVLARLTRAEIRWNTSRWRLDEAG